MDWIMYVALGVITISLIVVAVLAIASWFADSLLGKSDSWLEYGLDDDEI